MTRLTLALVIIALAVGVLGGWLGSTLWPGRPQDQAASADVARQLDELRAQNTRMGAQLETQRARAESAEADARRERELNMRLQALVGSGKK
jgi:hypothetical protein